MATHISSAAQNAAGTAVTALIDAGAAAGILRVYGGTMPADANTAVTGDVLAEFTLSDPAVAAWAAGTAALDVDPALTTTGTVAAGAGTAATHARFLDSDANTVLQGDVTATSGGGMLELNTTTISDGVSVEVTGFNFTMPDGT